MLVLLLKTDEGLGGLGGGFLDAAGWIVFTLGDQRPARLLFQDALHWVGEPACSPALGNPAAGYAQGVANQAASAEMFQGFVVGHGFAPVSVASLEFLTAQGKLSKQLFV
jgi:hypothetical protein